LPTIRFMKAYSTDLRERAVAACHNGLTEKEAAQQFSLSLTSVQRYKRQLKDEGHLNPKPLPGRARIIKADQQDEFRELVASGTDWTLDSLGDAWKERCGIKPTVSVLSDTCKRLKITYKKRVASPAKETPRKERTSRRR
jgi:transposase